LASDARTLRSRDAAPQAVGALLATGDVARLFAVDPHAAQEVLGNGFPVRPTSWSRPARVLRVTQRASARELAYLWRIDAALRAALPDGVPVVLAGDGALVARLSPILSATRPVLGLLAASHPSVASPPGEDPDLDALLGFARRAARR
jgi:antitoxin (DNA-binding transcriptional repressor) of toxin-antitoxin stability system